MAFVDTPTAQLVLPELPRLPEGISLDSPNSPLPPPPIEKDSVRRRSTSSTRRRPPLPPKEIRPSRGSTLHLVSTNPDLLTPPNGIAKRRAQQKHRGNFFGQLASIKHWFKESAKRAKSPAEKSDSSTLKSSPQDKKPTADPRRSAKTSKSVTPIYRVGASGTPTRPLSGSHYPRPKVPTPGHRSSLSPAPITPRSSYRHLSGTGGLRGRKSTSSSVSSIRSIHHIPSHSKASSTSSTSNSIHSNVNFSRTSRSPHSSVKVLPSTPTVGTFPSNIRVVRASPNYNETANFASPTGLIFAKRKRTPFRGPALSVGTNTGSSPAGRPRDSSTGGSRSASVAGRASGEIIKEEDEDEVEEVDAFSPVPPEAEETILGGENEDWIRRRHE